MSAATGVPTDRSDDTIHGVMRGLTIEKTDVMPGWVGLSVSGEIDLATVEDLDRDIKGVLADATENLVVDLSGTDFMDSTGLRCLVMADRSFREAGRKFALVVNGGPVSRLIDLSGVDTELMVVADVGELSD